MIKGSVPSTKIGASEHVKEKTKTKTGQTKRRHDQISHLNSLYIGNIQTKMENFGKILFILL